MTLLVAMSVILCGQASASTQANLREASQFAQTLLQARKLIDENYILPERGLPALRAGLRALLADIKELPEDIRQRLERMDQLHGVNLARLLEDVYLRTATPLRDPDVSRLELCLSNMASSLDPYSAYIPPRVWEEIQAESNGGFVGIGVKLREQENTMATIVETTIFQSPAFQSGICAQDQIVAVDGVDTSTAGMEKTAKLLAGPEGKLVRLAIQRPGVDEILQITTVRKKVRIESVVGLQRRPDYSWDYWLDKQRGVGYVRLTTFAAETADDLQKVLHEYQSAGMTSLVLDLRCNAGGLLESALAVGDLFLDRGLIVSICDRNGIEERKSAHSSGTVTGLKLAVLVNRESASGSEIVAAAIADHRRGIIIGERTFGKGSIQNLHPFQDDTSVLKLTTATFHRPNGENLHRFPQMTEDDVWGVKPTPGFEIPTNFEEIEKLRKRFLQQEVVSRPDQPPAVQEFDDPVVDQALEYLVSQASRN